MWPIRLVNPLKMKTTMKVLILLPRNGCGPNCLSDTPIFQKFVIFPSWSWPELKVVMEFLDTVVNSEAYCNFVMISMKVLILLPKNGCGLNYLSDMPIFQKSRFFKVEDCHGVFGFNTVWWIQKHIVILWSFCFENIPTFYCLFIRSNTLVSYFKYDLPHLIPITPFF